MLCRRASFVLILMMLVLVGCSREAKKVKFLSSAQKYQRQGKLPEAAIQYRNALRVDPNLAEARVGLGEVLLAQRDIVGAESELRNSLNVSPNNLRVLTLLGDIYLQAGKIDWAREKAAVAFRIDPENIDAKLLSAQIQLLTKQPQGAEKLFRDILAKDNNNARAWLGLAAASRAQHDLDGAERALRQAVTSSNGNSPMLMNLATFLEQNGKAPEALKVMEEAARKDGTSLNVLVPLAASYKRAGNLSQAEAILAKVRDLSPKASPYRILLANYYLITSQQPKAKQELEMLVRSDGLESPAGARLGDLLVDDHKLKEASVLAEQVVAKNKKSALAAYLKGRIKLAQGDGIGSAQQFDEATHYMSSAPRLYYYKGLAFMAQNKPQEAKAEFSKTLELDPAYYEALLKRAAINLALGDVKAAMTDSTKLVQLHPTTESITLYVQVLTAQGQFKRAEELLKSLIMKVQPGTTRSLFLSDAAFVSMSQKKFPEAYVELEQAHADAPESVVPSQLLASLYIMQEKLSDAERSITTAQQQYPNSTELKLMLGEVYLRQRQFSQANVLYRQLLAANPDNVKVRFAVAGAAMAQQEWITAAKMLETLGREHQAGDAFVNAGQAREKAGDVETARKDYEDGLKLKPNSAVALNNVSCIYLSKEWNTDVALGYAQRAKELMPNSPEISDTLAWAYYHKNRYQFAVDLLRTALSQQPDRALYHYHLGKCYIGIHDHAGAKQELQKALHGTGDFPREDAVNQLKTLETSR